LASTSWQQVPDNSVEETAGPSGPAFFMNKTVIVGDTSEDLRYFAESYDKNAVLWSNQNSDLETVFLSIGDTDLSTFLKILLDAELIIYHDISNWSTKETKTITDNIIYLLYINGYSDRIIGFPIKTIILDNHQLNIDSIDSDLQNNLLIQKICQLSKTNLLGLSSHRRSIDKQIWTAGCSYAHGTGLDSRKNCYGNLIAEHFGLSFTNIGYPGTSVDFAADQIIRSSIMPGDLVIWGITNISRYTWVTDSENNFVCQSFLDQYTDSTGVKKYLTQMYADEARLRLAQRHILQVQEFCNKIGCNLILFFHEDLNINSYVSNMKLFFKQFPEFVDVYKIMSDHFSSTVLNSKMHLDIGTDGIHPGSKTHAAWAEIITNFINSNKLLN